MTGKMQNTEEKIYQAANDVFLKFGYHGATLAQIGLSAGVGKASIHYYFRSKEKLYKIVVKANLERVLYFRSGISANDEINMKTLWFFYTEIYNNYDLFKLTLMELYSNEWECKLKDIKNWLELSDIPVIDTRLADN